MNTLPVPLIRQVPKESVLAESGIDFLKIRVPGSGTSRGALWDALWSAFWGLLGTLWDHFGSPWAPKWLQDGSKMAPRRPNGGQMLPKYPKRDPFGAFGEHFGAFGECFGRFCGH